MTVFGILHLVLAAYGIFGIASLLLMPVLMSSFSKGNPQIEAQAKVQQGVQWFYYLSSGMAAILAVMLVVAGIKLLRNKRGALPWSNAYSFTSIVFKVATVYLNIAFVAPLMRHEYEELKVSTPAMLLSTPWFVIMGILPMIYPLLAWLLLRRPVVKSWFAHAGT